MITNVEYGAINDRAAGLDYLGQRNFSRVIDIGASCNLWADGFVSHVVDINIPPSNTVKYFQGNISDEPVWNLIHEDVKQHGLFDFAICTHTLEDILNPMFVIKHMSSIAKEGIIAMPSKWVELSRSSRPFKGWIHHRWLFDVIDNKLVCVPKLPYLEYIDTNHFKSKPEEIRIYWKDELPATILNDDYIGPSEEAYLSIVTQFLSYEA